MLWRWLVCACGRQAHECLEVNRFKEDGMGFSTAEERGRQEESRRKNSMYVFISAIAGVGLAVLENELRWSADSSGKVKLELNLPPEVRLNSISAATLNLLPAAKPNSTAAATPNATQLYLHSSCFVFSFTSSTSIFLTSSISTW